MALRQNSRRQSNSWTDKFERDGNISSDESLRLAASRASCTGTFVNRETTSNDTKRSSGRMALDVMNDTNTDELRTNESELPINGAKSLRGT